MDFRVNFVRCGVLVAEAGAARGDKGQVWCSYVCLHRVRARLPLSVRPPLRATAPHNKARPSLCATGININTGVQRRELGNGAGGHRRGALS